MYPQGPTSKRKGSEEQSTTLPLPSTWETSRLSKPQRLALVRLSHLPNPTQPKILGAPIDKHRPELVAGPYSQAIRTPHAIYVSGQLPALADGTLPSGTMAYKTSLCIKNIHEILKEAGSDLSKVVKMTVFLTNMGDFAEVNREYELHFRDTRPARSCVAVKELPKGVAVEMECVALP